MEPNFQTLTCADPKIDSYAVGFDPAQIPLSDLLFMELPPQNIDGTGSEQFRRFGFWVKNQKLIPLSSNRFTTVPSLPQSPFPFSRLASMVPTNGSHFFIYHQLNVSSFAEDRWDDSLGGWVSNSFEISMT